MFIDTVTTGLIKLVSKVQDIWVFSTAILVLNASFLLDCFCTDLTMQLIKQICKIKDK